MANCANQKLLAVIFTTLAFASQIQAQNVSASAPVLDLKLDAGLVASSLAVDTIYVPPDGCYVNEGCVGGVGQRRVLRFSTKIDNYSGRDVVVGGVPACPSNPYQQVAPQGMFNYDTCHRHWHFSSYTSYKMTTPSGSVLSGRKNGFCLMDTVCPANRKKFDCQNQGITAGCSDLYDRSLPCQWVDITPIADPSKPWPPNDGTPMGPYYLTVELNPQHSIPETDFSNNGVTVEVWLNRVPQISGGGGTVEPAYQCGARGSGRRFLTKR